MRWRGAVGILCGECARSTGAQRREWAGAARIARAPIVYQVHRGTTMGGNSPGTARIAKALIVCQSQGEERGTQWGEWPGAARIANRLIVWERYRGTDPTQWRERPRNGPDRRSAHCVGALWGDGYHTMREIALPGWPEAQTT
jgi:hypothetical protein